MCACDPVRIRLGWVGGAKSVSIGRDSTISTKQVPVPGTAGFVSKWYLIQGAAEAQLWWLIIVIVASSVLAVFYVGRVIEVAYFREPAVEVARKPPAEMLAVTWILALATIWFGIETDINAGVAADAARELLAGWGSK